MRVAGVEYDVNWRRFHKGTSLFFPCLDPKKAKAEVRAEVRRLGLTVAYKSVLEDGVRGLRIWRV